MFPILLALLLEWKSVFAQERTALRAVEQAIASACVVGTRTIARAIAVRGRDQQSWHAEYKLHSRSPWPEQELFEPVLSGALALCPGPLVVLAGDDTRLAKTGKTIETAHWGRDPLSPPFRHNLQWGLRFLHGALIVPSHRSEEVAPRALPVYFKQVPPPRKPGKQATPEQHLAYTAAKKQKLLSVEAVAMLTTTRAQMDAAQASDKTLVGAFDASFCNKVVFTAELERTIVVARTRKDARLCFRATSGRRVYDVQKFTPEQVLRDAERPWVTARIFHSGKWRDVRYKEVNHVLWQGGAKRRDLRLLVVEPTPYRTTKAGRLYYREPAFLLCTDTSRDAVEVLQAYFDRWQIEVAHREMKSSFGVGDAQVRSPKAVARQPVLSVAAYSAMHLAALLAFGARRPECMGRVPKWQREQVRPSCQDLVRQLRKEVIERPKLVPGLELTITAESILATAAA